jgi:zinc transport system permease protein
MTAEWVADLLDLLAGWFGTEPFVVKAVVAILLVCLLCGTVGSLVVGNRMAFFSDTMAHCAFAGVTLGLLSVIVVGRGKDMALIDWVVPTVMILIGAGAGAAIVSVREWTALASDTVIGVFFALAIGFAAMLFPVLRRSSTFDPEGFLFGSPLFIRDVYLVFLLALMVLVAALFCWRYNQFVFASLNPSLARTRRLPLAVNNYLFIVALAFVVNLSILAVGALLINGLLIVPGASATAVARNARQMFWYTVLYCVAAGLGGLFLSMNVRVTISGERLAFGPSGLIVVVGVGLFFLTWGGVKLRRAYHHRARPA